MLTLVRKLESRIEDKFFGAAALNLFHRIDSNTKRTIETNLLVFLQTAVNYLKKWFDFSEDNILCKFRPFALKRTSENISFSVLQNITEVLHLECVDIDCLYDEYISIKTVITSNEIKESAEDVNTKWMNIFTK